MEAIMTNKTKTYAIILVLVGLTAAFFLMDRSSNQVAENEKEILYWVAPMDPNYRRDEAGKSPMGMDLIPVYEEGANTGDAKISINPAIVQNLGIRSETAHRRPLSRTLKTVGYVVPNDEATAHVHVRVQGWVERLYVKTKGEIVQKGDPLFEIYSPDLATAQEEYLQALRIAQTSLLKASRTRLASMGMTDEGIEALAQRGQSSQLVTIYAPQDGYIDALNIGEGMFVKPGTTIAVLVGSSNAWVLADVYEQQSAWFAEGDKAHMRHSAYPDRVWDGKVSYIYPTIDATSRTLKVRLEFPNEAALLKPNMYTQLSLFGQPMEDVLVVAETAVIRKQNMSRVILDLGDGRFRPAEVETGLTSEGYVEIIAGLAEGEAVVTSGQFLLDSEASVDSSLIRLSSEAPRSLSEVTSQTETAEPLTVDIMATVEGVMAGHNMITLAHPAIAAWGWPEMVMDFTLSDDVDISDYKVKDRVHVVLEKNAQGGVIITHIMLVERPREPSSDAEASPAEMDHSMHNMSHHEIHGDAQ